MTHRERTIQKKGSKHISLTYFVNWGSGQSGVSQNQLFDQVEKDAIAIVAAHMREYEGRRFYKLDPKEKHKREKHRDIYFKLKEDSRLKFMKRIGRIRIKITSDFSWMRDSYRNYRITFTLFFKQLSNHEFIDPDVFEQIWKQIISKRF